MIEITMENVLPLLKAAVDTQGEDFVYSDGNSKCVYVPLTPENLEKMNLIFDPKIVENDPRVKTGCLIGTMLNLAGVSNDVLIKHPNDSVCSVVGVLNRREIANISSDAAVLLGVAQRAQDGGSSWGKAYEMTAYRHAAILAPQDDDKDE